MNEKRRRCFQFRLRTLFAAVALLSIPLVCVEYYKDWIRARRQALPRLNCFENAIGDPNGVRAPWALQALGEDGVPTIFIDPTSSIGVEEAVRLFPEAAVIEVDRRPTFFKD